MKIGHFILSLGTGGAEKLLVDTLPKYKKLGHNVSIIQLSSILESSDYVKKMQEEGIELVSLSKGKLRNPMLIFKLRKLLKQDFDIVHVHLFPTLYFISLASLFLRKKPWLVFTEHSISNGRNNKPIFKHIERLIYKRYDAIIVISENIKAMLQKWLNSDRKITLIRNGVDIKKFGDALPYNDDYFKNEFNIKDNSFKLFMTARFGYPKDHATVVNALMYLPEQVHLFFVGDGLERKQIEQLCIEKKVFNRVHFLGFRNDIPRLNRSANINILSSLYEGMSGVALEAMASGRPFIGSNIIGINDIVPNDDFLFETQNHTDLSNKILSIMNDHKFAKKLEREGLQKAAQFAAEIMIDNHLKLYNSLLSRK